MCFSPLLYTCGDPGGTGYLPALCKVSARLTAEYATCVSDVAVGAVMLLVLVLGLKLMVVFLFLFSLVYVIPNPTHLKHHLTLPSSWLWQGGHL